MLCRAESTMEEVEGKQSENQNTSPGDWKRHRCPCILHFVFLQPGVSWLSIKRVCLLRSQCFQCRLTEQLENPTAHLVLVLSLRLTCHSQHDTLEELVNLGVVEVKILQESQLHTVRLHLGGQLPP